MPKPLFLALPAAAILGAAAVGVWMWSRPAPAPEVEGAIPVPSGAVVTLIDVILNEPGPAGLTARFRFLAPEVASLDQPAAEADMTALCQTYALPRLPATGPQPEQVVISLADRVVPFGDAAPEATQLFGAFSLRDGTCIWELF